MHGNNGGILGSDAPDAMVTHVLTVVHWTFWTGGANYSMSLSYCTFLRERAGLAIVSSS